MPSSHLNLCRPLLLLLSVFPSIRVFSNESALRIRWPKYWGFSFTSFFGVLQEMMGVDHETEAEQQQLEMWEADHGTQETR